MRNSKARISALMRGRRFIDWREAPEFARDLCDTLSSIRETVMDPINGLSLVEAFYQTDKSVLGRCDDSDGMIGDVYRMDARELFEHYGCQCSDKNGVSDLLFSLTIADEVCVRETIIECAGEVLDEPQMRALIDRFTTYADRATGEHEKHIARNAVKSIAEQLGDPVLFEQTWLGETEKPWPKLWIEIARQYLLAGDVDAAYDRVSKISENDMFAEADRNALLLEIYGKKGWDEKQLELLNHMFRSNYSAKTLDALLAVVGEERRDELVATSVADILQSDQFSYTSLRFLLYIRRHQEAENYLVNHVDQINGDIYYHWLPVAEEMDKAGQPVAASLVYRALLLSILKKANTKVYPHAARYLRKLDRLAEAGEGRVDIEEHLIFKERLLREHGKKKSFWMRYEAAK